MQISGVDLITELEHIGLIFRHVQETDNFLTSLLFLLLCLDSLSFFSFILSFLKKVLFIYLAELDLRCDTGDL